MVETGIYKGGLVTANDLVTVIKLAATIILLRKLHVVADTGNSKANHTS